jgi:hypothetical protein
MRRVLLSLAIVGLIVVAALVAALLSLNHIVAANHDRIVERVAAAIGRPVQVDAITVSLRHGLGLRLLGVHIADDPRFGPGDFLQAASITGRTSLWPLLHGSLHVNAIEVTDPVVRIVRDAAGAWNVRGVADAAPRPIAGEPPSPISEALAVFVTQAGIENGTLDLTDLHSGRPETVRATHIDLTLADVSESTPIPFSLDAAVDGEARNVRLTGSVGPLNDGTAVPVVIDGVLGPVGPQQLRVDGHMAAVLTPTALSVTTVAGNALGGQFSFKGELPRQADGPAWLTGTVTGVDVARLLRVAAPAAALRLTGTAEVSADLRSADTAPEALQHNLRGTLDVTVRNGVIQDFNIVTEVLGKITALPTIATLISASAKPKYGRLFSTRETRLETMHATFRVAEQRLQTDDLSILAADYGVRAAGWVSFDQHVDMVGTLTMSERFSGDVAADFKEIRRILDEHGQLVIPFRWRGKLGRATPRPEVGGLLQAVTMGAADDLVGKLLGGGTPKGTHPNPIEKSLRELFGH